VQRKQFRIEEMAASRRASPLAARHNATRAIDGDTQALARELAALRDALAQNTHELALLLNEGKERRMARAASELGAAVDVMEKSTDKILKSAEIIDDSAKTLSTSLKDDYNAGLAQEILDQLTTIYEACNFQDIAGQRIGKVVGTLGEIEDAVTRMLARCQGRMGGEAAPAVPAPRRDLLNGPPLDGDPGHASQCEIDALFG
jgi:chemotaxis protein CheZ